MTTPGMHPWTHPISVAYCPAYLDSVVEPAIHAVLDWFRASGGAVESRPDRETELILTTARFNQPVERDEALLFHAKRIYGLGHRPQILTVVSLRESEYGEQTQHFAGCCRARPRASG
ncbi:MAG: hypothetical protein HY784_06450 [Chloroflexi bacterium]|nr:hypothetical protein [Chloroflexota bacterium]